MTSPDFASPGGAQGALSLAGFYQNADPEAIAKLGNLDLFGVLEQVRESVFGMLGGFGDVAEAVWDAIQTLIEALTGGVGDGLDDVVEWVAGLGGAVADFLQGRIPLGWLTAETPNVLDNGAFDGEVSLVIGEGWTWDAAVGRTSPGSALFTASGVAGLQQSRPPFRVAEGQELAAAAWAKWAGLSTSSAGSTIRLSIRWWDGATLVAETLLETVNSPAASSDWVKLDGLATCPAGASLATVGLAVTELATAGSVWFDDAELRATAQSIPQRFVAGLEAILSALGEDIAAAIGWIKDLIERITGRAWSTLTDALSGLTTWTGQLGSILGGGNPTNVLPSLVGHTIGTLKQTVSQIGELFDGIVVTPINGIVQGVKDWLGDLFGWKNTTTSNHQGLNNAVWGGANQAEDPPDKTEEEVRQAVATLKARTDALRQENELRYQSAIAIWQGLVPGGDVTCPVNTLFLNGSQTTVALGQSPVTVFRARSDVERNWITFIGKASGAIQGFRALLWTYRYELDQWEIVAVTKDVAAELDTAGPGWVNAQLIQSYSPQVGELMAVSWTMYVNAQNPNSTFQIARSTSVTNMPAYDSVPYGNHGTVSQLPWVPVDADALETFTGLLNSPSGWLVGSSAFAQIAPDLGQMAAPTPTYWFDDFNGGGSDAYIARNGANTSFPNSQFDYSGTTDGNQSITLKKQMSTVNSAVEANLNGAETIGSSIAMHTNQAQGYGVWLSIHNDAAVLFTGDANGNTTERARASLSNGAARWKIEYQEYATRYLVYKNGNLVLQWTDAGNLAGRAKGRRSVSLRVNRSFFNNSPAWDDLLVYDVVEGP